MNPQDQDSGLMTTTSKAMTELVPSDVQGVSTKSKELPRQPLPMMESDGTTSFGSFPNNFMYCGQCSSAPDTNPVVELTSRPLDHATTENGSLQGPDLPAFLHSEMTFMVNPTLLFCSPCAATNSDESTPKLEWSGKTALDDYTTIVRTLGTTRRTQLTLTLDEKDDGLDSSSRVLVIQSLLRPLNGVDDVKVSLSDAPPSTEAEPIHNAPSNVWRCHVMIDHDMQTSPDQIVSLIQQSLKCTARLLSIPEDKSTDQQPMMVRSQFQVQGMCCASEIPSVQKILRLSSVAKVQINITTQTVYLQHVPSIVSAQDIARKLTQQGFPATILKDGGAQHVQLRNTTCSSSSQQQPYVGRTALHVEQVLTEQDSQELPHIWSNTNGVVRVGVNVRESVVYIEHNVQQVNAEELLEVFLRHMNNKNNNDNNRSYAAKIVVNGKEELEQREFEAFAVGLTPSKYVESTLLVSNLTLRHVPIITKALKQNFIRAQVRAFYPHVPSRTLKVEHNPELMGIQQVVDLLMRYGLQATVVIDGAVDGLALPLMEDYPSDGSRTSNLGKDNSRSSLRLNVVLSGVFWGVSVLSFVGGVWHYLEYAGLLSVLFGLPPVALKAWRTINRCQFDANCMMVVAALGALALGEIEEAASVSFLFAISEFLENRATARARQALGEIVNLRPDHANVIHPSTKEIIVVPADKVPIGSLVSVRTGDKIVADGVIIEGTSTVDESSLTGEAVPVPKSVGDIVSGGSINVGGTRLVVKTTTTVDDSAVSRLIRLVEEAQANRSPTELLIDSFARTYTPAVVTMAAIMCTVPWVFGRETGRHWTLNGLIIIVVACPCALTISTPVTYAAGLAATAQRGVIVKGGARLEALGSVDKVIFDKTGTLTHGNFTVRHLEKIGAETDRKKMLELLALIEAPSSHPLAATLVKAARMEGVSIPKDVDLLQHTILKGEGVTATIDGVRVFAGNKFLFERIGMYADLPVTYRDLYDKWSNEGGTVGFLGVENKGVIATYCVEDAVREEAKDVIRSLQEGGIEVIILTGDSDGAAKAIALQVGLPQSSVHSQLLPEDKLRFVGSLAKSSPRQCGLCRPKSLVLMCGDGVNDAPALAAADVGVAMGEGAALAMEMSDITLMDSNLSKLVYAIKMGTRVLHTVQENILLSLLSKLIVVGLTFAGKMTLLTAIASDVCVMLLVTLNGMKLLPGHTSGSIDVLRARTQRSRKYEKLVQRSFHGPNTAEIV